MCTPSLSWCFLFSWPAKIYLCQFSYMSNSNLKDLLVLISQYVTHAKIAGLACISDAVMCMFMWREYLLVHVTSTKFIGNFKSVNRHAMLICEVLEVSILYFLFDLVATYSTTVLLLTACTESKTFLSASQSWSVSVWQKLKPAVAKSKNKTLLLCKLLKMSSKCCCTFLTT